MTSKNILVRSDANPLLEPDPSNIWEARARFNPCVVKDQQHYLMWYRAISADTNISTIGACDSTDGIHFGESSQIIRPEFEWEKYGCEDPRVTYLDNQYFIFYTALSEYPFKASGIRIGLAVSGDGHHVDAKYPVTPFNSKAMTLFPEKINGKICALLTVHTDSPPPKIALAQFETFEQIWSQEYWNEWYKHLDSHVIPLLRSREDYVEVGAPPVKTPQGWLIFYSYMHDFYSGHRRFTIEAALLDLHHPQHVIGRTTFSLLDAEMPYEKLGDVSNVVFPSGAIIEGDEVHVYYGAADTYSCMASMKLSDLLETINAQPKNAFIASRGFERFSGNPILKPIYEHAWESAFVFNPGIIYLDNRVHILYRAISRQNASRLGYACSSDGFHIDERSASPIYSPRDSFELPYTPGVWHGCEDARLTLIDDRIYMCYTAYDGRMPRVAFTSIAVDDFLAKRWKWAQAQAITDGNSPDKNACLFPRKIQGKYAFFHRPNQSIYLTYVDNLDAFMLEKGTLLDIKPGVKNISKVGITGPPIEIPEGWLLIYHMVNADSHAYQISAVILDAQDPTQIISTKDIILLKPETDYETVGNVPNVVFSCGAALIEDMIYLYYGAADQVIGVARMSLRKLVQQLL